MGVRAALESQGLRPQKKFGQNFLTDARILSSIADAAEITNSDTILEIGPGLGHLTRTLAERAARVIAVELDRGLAQQLRDELGLGNFTILQGDFLERTPSEWLKEANASAPFKVVANVPYYITSAIMRHILEAEVKPSMIVITLQKEVAHRIVAQPPEMNLLAVSAQFFSKPRIVRTIPAGAFYPRPKVDSAVVRLDVYPDVLFSEIRSKDFFRVVRAGFGERRKQLRNALAHNLPLAPAAIDAALGRAHIAPTRRAETLQLREWAALQKELDGELSRV